MIMGKNTMIGARIKAAGPAAAEMAPTSADPIDPADR